MKAIRSEKDCDNEGQGIVNAMPTPFPCLLHYQVVVWLCLEGRREGENIWIITPASFDRYYVSFVMLYIYICVCVRKIYVERHI